MHKRIAFLFISISVLCLISGMFFGVAGGFQYILPGFLKEQIAFSSMRPLHVTLVISWIFAAAIGGIYYYLPVYGNKRINTGAGYAHAILFVLTGITIITC